MRVIADLYPRRVTGLHAAGVIDRRRAVAARTGREDMKCGFASIAKQKAVANGPTRLENIAEDEHGAAHPRELLLRGAVETPTGECQREEEGGTNGLSLRHTLFSFLCSVIV